ncbi:MAG: UvrD-helicase domain-containing protein, partial [bacterium]|nr:UvrD-helicase domain-containing protein [bacterium]
MSDEKPIWEVLDCESDAIIQASAGTGKTFALEHIVGHLVTKGIQGKPIDVRNLLLVTFTEKAAGELRERIRKMLSTTSKEAEKHLDEATICTIHSFCQELLREYPFESGMLMKTEVVGSDQELVDLAAHQILTSGGFVQKIKGLVDDHLRIRLTAGVLTDRIFRNLENLSYAAKLRRSDVGLTFESLAGLVSKRILKDDSRSVDDFRSRVQEHYRTLTDEQKKAAKGCAVKSSVVDAAVELALPQYLQLKKRARSITFDDMVLETSRVVKDAVVDSGNAAKQAFLKKIRSRYRIALVDEFQDTDDKQWAIFDSLFSSRVNRLEGANPVQGCLIVVGDPKQAIYRFRGADIDTYLRAKKEILERTNRTEPHKLGTMYRSTEEMVRAFNAIFKNTEDNSVGWFKGMASNGLPIEYDEVKFPTQDVPAGVKDFNYPPHEGSEDERERAVELLETIPKDVADAKPNVCLPIFLENMAAEMKRLHESAFWMAREDPKDCMNWSAMCVLAKSHADCEAAQRVLRAKGIPCRQYKESGLFDSVESESVLALFDYLSMPRSSGNLAALLLTPLFEVPLAEVEKKLEAGTGEVEALCDKWRSYIARCEWVKFFESVMNETALGRPHPGDADHVRHRSGVRQIFDQLLERHGRARELSVLTDALRHWRRDDGDAGEEGSVRNKESESDAVQIMTMHASKGLEFNAVFVPYGYKEMILRQTPKEDKPAEVLEVKRLLYVALTRAKYKLYLPWSKRM